MPPLHVSSRSGYFRAMADRSRERLREARLAADGCLRDEAVHRQAMKAVFALEDTLFVLEQIARVYEGSTAAWPSWAAYPADDAA